MIGDTMEEGEEDRENGSDRFEMESEDHDQMESGSKGDGADEPESEEKLEEEIIRSTRNYMKDNISRRKTSCRKSASLDDFYRELARAMRHLPGFSEFDDNDLPEMDAGFERMRQYLDDFILQAIQNDQIGNNEDPIVYGFSVKPGPDGKPRIRRLDKRPPGPGEKNIRSIEGTAPGEIMEPLAEVVESEDTVFVTIEMPGISKEDIDIEMDENEMSVSVDTSARRFYKHLEFPARVKPGPTRATFNNGVLDLQMEKHAPNADGRQRVDIN